MKKKLLTLAKGLDFESETDYFNYCIDSYINGNFTQCKRLFKDMGRGDQKDLIEYIRLNAPECYDFYIDLL